MRNSHSHRTPTRGPNHRHRAITAAELDVENCRPIDFPEPRRVYASIRYPSKAIRVQAHAIAYTKTAVKIRFFEPVILIQREGRVWLSSVTPAPPKDEA